MALFILLICYFGVGIPAWVTCGFIQNFQNGRPFDSDLELDTFEHLLGITCWPVCLAASILIELPVAIHTHIQDKKIRAYNERYAEIEDELTVHVRLLRNSGIPIPIYMRVNWREEGF